MKMSKKSATGTIWACIIALAAVLMYLVWTKVLDNDWLWPLILVGTIAITGGVMFIQSRIDPEAHKAWRNELMKESEEEEKAIKEINSHKIKRTLGGTICEFITVMLLIVSWILIWHKGLATNGDNTLLKIGILFTVGAIWFLATAYFHRVMGFQATTFKQLQLGIYRKRALAMGCAIFLMIGALFDDAESGKVAEGLLIAFALTLILVFGSKFVINSIKK